MGTKFLHDRFGECELIRIEGVDWILRCSNYVGLYRVPPSMRHDFTAIASSQSTSPRSTPGNLAAPEVSQLRNDSDGVGKLLSAIRSRNRPVELRESKTLPRGDSFSNLSKPVTPPILKFVPAVTEATLGDGRESPGIDSLCAADRRRLCRVFESLRNGLTPVHVDSRPFAVGIEAIQGKVNGLLAAVELKGGCSVVIRGAYGQGKTFSLELLKQLSLEAGYVIASTEIDAFENQLKKPHFIYRSLMQNLRFPDAGVCGARGLVFRTQEKLRSALGTNVGPRLRAIEARRILEEVSQCRPLAWLLSDVTQLDNPELVGLLACQPGVTPASARRVHILGGEARDWPAFNAGTQGDFGSYVLSGISRLSRFLGYRGLIVVLDEMEKWQDLDWKAQSHAGNLLGGLIWAAGAERGKRSCKKTFLGCDHSRLLSHSVRCGGYPFSTIDPCHLGLAIAMTPRGDDGPESFWSRYGSLEIVDLPGFTPELLGEYIQRVFPVYCQAYDIKCTMPMELPGAAIRSWRLRGDGSTRLAVQSVLKVLDDWRQTLVSYEV